MIKGQRKCIKGELETSVADPYIEYTDPEPALFSIYGSESRLFIDTQIMFSNFFKKNSCLIHISFDHEKIPLKEIKNLVKT